jgi:hypothetical protein
MKVTITSSTGSSVGEALLDKDSGVLEYTKGELKGEISHIHYEKSMGRVIRVVVEAKAPKEVHVHEEVKIEVPVKKTKVKTK